MAKTNQLETIIPRIVDSINFENFLIYKGYEKKTSTIEGYIVYKKTINNTEDIILLTNVDSKDFYYSLTYKDKGNVIEFVKNRIEIDYTNNLFNPDKDHLIEACTVLVAFIDKNGENKKKVSGKSNKDDINNLIKNSFTIFYNVENIDQLVDLNFFKKFNIDKKIINDSLFQNKIFSTKGLMLNNIIHNDIINSTYPIYDEYGNECGMFSSCLLSNKNEVINFYVPGTNKSGIWLSNRPDIHPNNKLKFTVVDKPIEALAHYSYMKEERYYASIFEPDQNTYEILKSNMNHQNSNLVLALSISIQNFEYEIKLILEFLNVNLKFVKSTYDYMIISLSNTEEIYFENFLKKIKKLNLNNVSKAIKVLGNNSKEHLQKSVILASADENNNLTVLVPKNFKTLYQFEKLLIKTFPSKYNISIEKPKHIDWVTQNKSKTTKKVAVQELIEEEQIFILNN